MRSSSCILSAIWSRSPARLFNSLSHVSAFILASSRNFSLSSSVDGIFPPDTAAEPPKKNSNRIAKWIILACTCYIWIPLLTTWYSLLLTALIVLAVIPIALCAALLGGLFTFVLALFQDVPSALMQLGMGLACGGVAALVAYPIWIACKSIVKFALFTTKKMWHFVTKGDDTP